MLSVKIRIYNMSCKWLDVCINVFWPLVMAGNLAIFVWGFFFDSWTSLAFLIPSALNFIVLLICELLIREGDVLSYKMWYLGHISTFSTSVLAFVLFLALGALSTSQAINNVATDPSLGNAIAGAMDMTTEIMVSSFGWVVSLTLAVDFLIIFICSIIYIRKRQDLFWYQDKAFRNYIAQMLDDEDEE